MKPTRLAVATLVALVTCLDLQAAAPPASGAGESRPSVRTVERPVVEREKSLAVVRTPLMSVWVPKGVRFVDVSVFGWTLGGGAAETLEVTDGEGGPLVPSDTGRVLVVAVRTGGPVGRSKVVTVPASGGACAVAVPGGASVDDRVLIDYGNERYSIGAFREVDGVPRSKAGSDISRAVSESFQARVGELLKGGRLDRAGAERLEAELRERHKRVPELELTQGVIAATAAGPGEDGADAEGVWRAALTRAHRDVFANGGLVAPWPGGTLVLFRTDGGAGRGPEGLTKFTAVFYGKGGRLVTQVILTTPYKRESLEQVLTEVCELVEPRPS